MGKNKDFQGLEFETLAVHAGQHPDHETGALVSPIYKTSTFVFTEDRMERWLAGAPHEDEIIYTYGRSRNPTQVSLQQKIAALEHAEASLVTSSGMAAISMAVLGYCKSGDHLISAQTVYGGTFNLFDHVLKDLGIEVTFLEELNRENLDKAKRDNTKLVYFETISNPTLDIPEIEEIVAWSKENGVNTIVDSTFTSPYLFRPLDWGIDTAIHSCTKYINGHGDVVAGAIVGTEEYCEGLRSKQYMDIGPVLAPDSCYMMLRGLKTLHLRMEKHCDNAMEFAKAMKDHPKIKSVIYPGLEDDKNYERAKKYFDGFGGMVGIVIDGDRKKAQELIFKLKLCYFAVSLGDLDTLVQIPATMTHRKVPKEDREKMGIEDGLIRVSLGVENVKDIINDFESALELI